jgi:carbamoyltransferase
MLTSTLPVNSESLPVAAPAPATTLVAAVAGATRNACVALGTGAELVGICEQERITRVRAAGFNGTGLPDEAIDELLRRSSRRRAEVSHYVVAEDVGGGSRDRLTALDHHFAHACSAFLPSPFESATIVVCDDTAPHVSVWDGDGTSITRIDWEWNGPGLAEIYSACAEAIGFTGRGREQRMEALARLDPTHHDDRIDDLIALDPDRLRLPSNWRAQVEGWVGASEYERAQIAAALQSRLSALLIEFLAAVKGRTRRGHLCLGGTLFSNSHFNARVKLCSGFDDVFVPVNPGDAGVAVGAAMHVSGQSRHTVTPFLGPSYTLEDMKAVLDNCKLQYECTNGGDAVAIAVEALKKGRLVAWFEGPMEWGPRALGARSILASPFSPYVLDNLNRFLKQRDPWRGYALSGLAAAVGEHFDGPDASPFMECDYAPKDRRHFRHVLPAPNAAVRVQTVGADAPPRFRELLTAFGAETGVPIVVNTSFNGFQEPIVCSPRDAVRVFFGTGIDVLVLERFLIRK